MKKTFLISLLLFVSIRGFSQAHLDQNGLKTTVTNTLFSTTPQALRFDIAAIGYNSHHWQHGGVIIIELFHQFYATGYEKYILENGHGQGANSGSPVLKLAESAGSMHEAKITLGTVYDLSTSYEGYVNRALPISVDIKGYSKYKVRITYMQEKVELLNDQNQIKINITPSGTAIPDFTTSATPNINLASSGNLQVTGSGIHYLENGSLGIGTADPKGYKLAVAGNMIAESVKVKLQGSWPDYVFSEDYKLPTLQETEKHIKENGHLEGIPSAKEVKADGIDLGEMNAKLLRKIEELTLYLIEQDKQLKEQNELLNSRIELQQDEINILKKAIKL